MSHVINVEVSDDTFRVLAHQARNVGDSPSILVTKLLESHYAPYMVHRGKPSHKDNFEALFGSIDLGYSTGMDNLQIDRDLEKAYGE